MFDYLSGYTFLTYHENPLYSNPPVGEFAQNVLYSGRYASLTPPILFGKMKTYPTIILYAEKKSTTTYSACQEIKHTVFQFINKSLKYNNL